MDTIQSPKGGLNYADVQRWLRNAWVFFAPVATIYLVFVAANLADGFNWSDFSPNPVVVGSMILYVVNVILDLARKVNAGPTQ